MSTAATDLMTWQEFLALPDDGTDRWLLRGHLMEGTVTVRNRFHSRVIARVSHVLINWLDLQPEPRGEVLAGEAGIRLLEDPNTVFGIDVAYVSPEVIAQQTDASSLIRGLPVLAVEVLSPYYCGRHQD